VDTERNAISEWIDASKELPEMHEIYTDSPKTSGNVLIFNGHYVSIGEYTETYGQRKPRWVNCIKRVANVTHWMPLPKGPL
jgi:hypothetical protein